ncbi:MAG: hypothetical protein QM769_03495 [Pseudoxanthomonas sp.]
MNTEDKLANLARIGHIKPEAFDAKEFDGLLRGAQARLQDARNTALSPESRFDLAYNAAHSLCLAAMRRAGYRPEKRFTVFQTLPHTLGLGPEVWRVLDDCHNRRNVAEYEGNWDADYETILKDLLLATDKVNAALATPTAP